MTDFSYQIHDLKQITIVQSQVACFYAELEGMKVKNEEYKLLYGKPLFTQEDFEKLSTQYGINYNQVITKLMN